MEREQGRRCIIERRGCIEVSVMVAKDENKVHRHRAEIPTHAEHRRRQSGYMLRTESSSSVNTSHPERRRLTHAKKLTVAFSLATMSLES